MRKNIFFSIVLLLLVNTSVFCQDNREIKAIVSPSLLHVLNTTPPTDSIEVMCSVKSTAASSLRVYGQLVYTYGNTIILRTTARQLNNILQSGKVLFADKVRVAKEELTTGAFDLSANKISLTHYNFPFANGNAIKISIKEKALDTTDIDIKGRYVNSGLAASAPSVHAAIMATILAGAGNSSNFAKGVAWGAFVTSSDFATLLPDPDSVYKKFAITVQNHSYGTGLENFYGGDASAYDMNVWKNPFMVHVFSAGNSGMFAPVSGTYAGIVKMANITGSFKMAKNILTVGHTDSAYTILPLSSKGPAYDGRVKPELVAFGEDGSSGAAALVSGSAALVQQAFKSTHNNNLPSAALVKATLLNSADDVGVKGIDYASGYGSLNTDAALKTILKDQFIESAVTKGEVKTYSFFIPANIAKFKITLAWTDTAALANASKALVNDIDAVLTLPATGESWQPWVLSSVPDKDSLLLPAVRKKDTLNNVEQITIDNPQAGTYSLEIKGTNIVTSTQPFAAAYQADTANKFVWSYPTSPDILRGGEKNFLRWQTTFAGQGILEYSMDGMRWKAIDSAINLSKAYFKWDVPDTVAVVFVRMQIGGAFFMSDSVVISKPAELLVGFNCADSFLLFWNKQNVTQYQVYKLGDKYLQPLLKTTDTALVFNKNTFPSLHYSVAPLIGKKPGLRSYTIDYTTQGAGCYLRNFFAFLQGTSVLLTSELGTLYDVDSVIFLKIATSGKQVLQSFTASGLNFSAKDLSLTRGVNRYQLGIKLKSGSVVYSNEEDIYYFPDEPVIIYPNPARQNEPVKIIVRDAFIYSVQVFDAVGKLIRVQYLDGFANQIPPLILSKGFYFVKVTTASGSLTTLKLIVQ